AADKLAEQGVSCEVIDVATVSPLDRETLLCSVAKTGRAVIIHEACRNGGVGAEVAASIAEAAFLDLQAPAARVTGYDTVRAYYRHDRYYLPPGEGIGTAVEQVIAL